MEDQNYNVVILGSSPLAITEAVWQKSKGNSVVNIDDKATAGGAWTTIKHEGIPAVEIGCHIWEVQTLATDFLDTFFKLDLVPLKPQPRIVKKRFSIPYDWKMNISTGKYIVSKLLRFQFKKLKAGLSTPARRFTLAPSEYLYPKGGANELHSSVLALIQSENLNIALNTEVKTVKIANKDVLLELKNGQQLRCEQLILTSLSSIENIEFEDGSSLSPDTKHVDYVHVHLKLNTKIPREFSYERWMDDEFIHRVSDMTSQVSDKLQPNEKLLCVGIHAEKYHASNHEVLLDEILNRLKDRKLIAPNFVLIEHGFNVFPTYYSDPSELTEIVERSNGKVAVLHSTNFTYSFFNQSDKYSELITSDTLQS